MNFQNISQVFLSTACTHPRNEIVYYSSGSLDSDQAISITYSDMLARTIGKASLLSGLGLSLNSVVLLQFDDHQSSVEWFWAVTLAGHTPAFSTPLARDERQREAYFTYVDDLLDRPTCLTSRKLLPQISSRTLNVVTAEDLEEGNKSLYAQLVGAGKRPSETAFIMLTSGSSGQPKAVMLPHNMVLHSVRGKTATLDTSADTPFLSWIGMDHVATLTEMHIHAILAGASQTFVQAADLAADPLVFLKLLQRHRISHSFAPHFFLASLEKTLRQSHSDISLSFDLGTLKTIVTGGEANVVDTCVSLIGYLTQYGAPPNVLTPAFGMTETSGGAIYNRRFPSYDIPLQREFASVGKPIPGLEIRITSDNGEPQPIDGLGHLQVRGPVVFNMYHKQQEATTEAFSSDGWFRTGDTGFIAADGMLHLVGRSKELIIVNGVNYSPASIEVLLEEVDGTTPGYTIVVPYRSKGAATEDLCIVYLPRYDASDARSRNDTNNKLTKLVVLHTGVRPLVVPLEESKLQKSTLGKLPRAKIQKALANDEYAGYIAFNHKQMLDFQEENFRPPKGDIEKTVARIVCESLDLPEHQIGANQSVFSLGVNSMGLIRLAVQLEQELCIKVPLLTVMTNPTIELLASALAGPKQEKAYDPMVVLNSEGSKTPLWLVHPGVGEVLVFLPLASYMTDRPVYALRARGFEPGQPHFANWQEARDTYLARIRSVQPHGPYAIAGYSYGSMIAFEISKELQTTDKVKFLGVFNLPPHIKLRMRQLDWTNCILHLSYFLGFFTDEFAQRMHPILQHKAPSEVVRWVLEVAPPERVREVDLDHAKLFKWANLASDLQHSAVDYEPSGKVACMDVFCATPLASVARGLDDWRSNHLGKWKDFSSETPRIHDVGGAHYTMLSPLHVSGFQKTLKAALSQRGL